ncbi:MAG: hypothetical protein NT003_05165 [Candidatus Magasanikbacteria bacterium]|nr:hypothetical protein [Candidatus Magasanikbacteria bacterium]
MDHEKEELQHKVFLLFISGACVLAVFLFVNIRTHASVTTLENPGNNAPTATITSIVAGDASNAVSVYQPLALVAGGTVPVRVNGTFTDADGCSEVSAGGRIDALLQRGSVPDCYASGFDVSDGGNSCYAVQGCTITSCSGTDANFECDFNVAYNADATDIGTFSSDQWTAYVSPLDQTMFTSGSTDTDAPGIASSYFEVALSPGIAAGQDVSFGSINLSVASSAQTLDVVNAGNTPIGNATVLMTPLLCRLSEGYELGSSGTIPANQVYAALTSGGTLTPLSDVTPTSLTLDIPIATTTVSSTKPIYLFLQMPPSEIGGLCTGTITVGLE